MRKLIAVFGFAAALLFAGSLTVNASPKSHAWTGWITDNMCGAKDMSADKKDCTISCVKNHGASYVFVTSKTKKVYAISNQDAVTEANIGQEVTVTGEMGKDGSIKVDSIK
jgi:hypothetical protein